MDGAVSDEVTVDQPRPIVQHLTIGEKRLVLERDIGPVMDQEFHVTDLIVQLHIQNNCLLNLGVQRFDCQLHFVLNAGFLAENSAWIWLS